MPEEEVTKILIAIEKLQGEVNATNLILKERSKDWDEHIEESRGKREAIESNTRFCKNAERAIWILFVSIVGIFSKMIFWR